METSPQSTEAKEPWHAPLNRVTTVLKILAAVVFITLPFVGFWLGVGYGSSEQIVPNLVSLPEQAPDDQSVAVEGIALAEAVATTTPTDSIFWQDVALAASDPVWSELATLFRGDQDGFQCDPAFLYRETMGWDSDIDQAESIPFRQLVGKISPAFVSEDGTQAIVVPCMTHVGANTSHILVLFAGEQYVPLQFATFTHQGGVTSGDYIAPGLEIITGGRWRTASKSASCFSAEEYELRMGGKGEGELVLVEYLADTNCSDDEIEPEVIFDSSKL